MTQDQYEAIFTAHGFRKDERGDYVHGDYDIWITVFAQNPDNIRFMVSTKRSTHATRPIEKLDEFIKGYFKK